MTPTQTHPPNQATGAATRCRPAWILIALLGAATLPGCTGEQGQGNPPRLVRTVQIAAADSPPDARQPRYPGRITPRHQVTLAFEASGRIASRAAEVGDRVTRGTILASLDESDLQLALQATEAELAEAKALALEAQAALRRVVELRKSQFVSDTEHDLAVARADATQARVATMAARLAAARRQLGYAQLRAPLDGVITARRAEAGQVVAADTPIYTLADDQTLEVTLDLPEQLPAAPGDLLQVAVWALPGRQWQARVREVSPVADGASRTYRVRATLLAGDGDAKAQDRPRLGMSASVRLPVAGAAKLVQLPATALLRQPDGPAVWVVNPDNNRVQRRAVTLGPVAGDSVTVVAGLQPGERVVTAGVHDLRQGQEVVLDAAELR